MKFNMSADDLYPTCYGLKPVTFDEPKPEAQPEPKHEPGFITELENAIVVIEEVMEPKTWIRKGAFGLARLIRRKLG